MAAQKRAARRLAARKLDSLYLVFFMIHIPIMFCESRFLPSFSLPLRLSSACLALPWGPTISRRWSGDWRGLGVAFFGCYAVFVAGDS